MFVHEVFRLLLLSVSDEKGPFYRIFVVLGITVIMQICAIAYFNTRYTLAVSQRMNTSDPVRH